MYKSRERQKILIILFISLLSGAGCSLQETQATSSKGRESQSVGWVERARIPGVEEEIEVKLDTGAETTSINAEILEEPDEDTESGGMIKFRFIDGEGNKQVFERPIVRWVRIKARAGKDLRRPVVRMRLCVAGRWIEEEVNLADRDDFDYPVLVGRNMLKQANFVVDSSRKLTVESTCPAAEE